MVEEEAKSSVLNNSGNQERHWRVGYPGNIFFFSTLSPQQNCKLLESKGHVFIVYCANIMFNSIRIKYLSNISLMNQK